MRAIAAIVGLGLSVWFTRLLYHGFYPVEILGGWGLAVLSEWAAGAIRAKSMGPDPHHFLRWSLGANSLRLALFLAILLAVFRWAPLQRMPFVVAALTSYLACMAGAVWSLHARSLKSP